MFMTFSFQIYIKNLYSPCLLLFRGKLYPRITGQAFMCTYFVLVESKAIHGPTLAVKQNPNVKYV
jgi:hypothetical protein